jgi:hypothetical protein
MMVYGVWDGIMMSLYGNGYDAWVIMEYHGVMEVHSTTWSTVGLGLGFWDEVMGTGKMYEYSGTHRAVDISA